MPLILTSQIKSNLKPDPEFLNHYIYVPSKIFSESYIIPDESQIVAYLESLGRWQSYDLDSSYELDTDLSDVILELENREILFIFRTSRMGLNDLLYFTSRSWNVIRDYGMLSGFHYIRIRIEKVTIDDKEILIFPKRDVKIVHR